MCQTGPTASDSYSWRRSSEHHWRGGLVVKARVVHVHVLAGPMYFDVRGTTCTARTALSAIEAGSLAARCATLMWLTSQQAREVARNADPYTNLRGVLLPKQFETTLRLTRRLTMLWWTCIHACMRDVNCRLWKPPKNQ